jgi:hypothetical protein
MAEIGDELAARPSERLIVRAALVAAILRQVDPLDARIADRGDHLGAVVGAAVADDEQFEVVEGLPQHASDRIGKHAAPIVGGDDDSDAGHVAAPATASTARQGGAGPGNGG